MIDIIAKIMKIKKEKNMSNKEIFPENWSYISKLKRGDIKMPTEQSLGTIANSFEISFDDLIHGTNWNKEQNEKAIQIKEFAISQSDIDCNFDDNGGYLMNYKTYPLYNSKGEKNEFCPYSGDKLITECDSCGRNIEFKNQEYCIKCGSQLINIPINNKIFTDMIEMLSVTNIYDVESLDKAIHSLADIKAFLTDDKQCLDNLRKDIKKINSKEFQKKYEKLNFEQFRMFPDSVKIGYSPMIDYKTIFNGDKDKTINSAKLLEALSRVAINLRIADTAINYYKSKLPADFDYDKRNKEFEERLQKDPAYQAQLMKTATSIENSGQSVEEFATKRVEETMALLYKNASKKEKEVLKSLIDKAINKEQKGAK